MLLLPTRPRRRYVPMMAALAFIDVAACCGVMAMEVVWNLDSIADIRAWVRIKTPPEDPILATLPLGARMLRLTSCFAAGGTSSPWASAPDFAFRGWGYIVAV